MCLFTCLDRKQTGQLLAVVDLERVINQLYTVIMALSPLREKCIFTFGVSVYFKMLTYTL